MKDSAILLNLTSKFAIGNSDPLISIISGDGSLLFYDRPPIDEFPSDPTLCQQYEQRLLANIRNLLEARSLSTQDNGERIRLIVTLDLLGGAFLADDPKKKCFPAQKVRRFKQMMEQTFAEVNLQGGTERESPLLKRFDYCFLFLVDNMENKETLEFYENLAYDGYSGLTSEEWIGLNSMKLNEFRDEILNRMNVPDDKWLLTKADIKEHYETFTIKLTDDVKLVKERMDEADMGTEFEKLFYKKVNHIRTIEDFRTFDYEKTIASCVAELIGLCSSEFRNNYTFFFLRSEISTSRTSFKSEAYVASLVQFLATISSEHYKKLLLSDKTTAPARVFSVDVLAEDNFDADAYASLENYLLECRAKSETARWKEDVKVECAQYTLKATESEIKDSQYQIRDNNSDELEKKHQAFFNIRTVPFFFGSSIGDWNWYRQVTKSVDDFYDAEQEHERPIFKSPRRISDNEMEARKPERSLSYAEIKELIIQKNEAVKNLENSKVQDLNSYLEERRDLMKKLRERIDELKGELVKLGYLACLFWLGLFATLTFTLCYAYHFFSSGSTEPVWLIAGCLGISVVVFILAAIVGQQRVKSKIKKLYLAIDIYYDQMNTNLQHYLEQVKNSAEQQNKADVERKNLDELQSKIIEFENHNKQVDLWVAHYDSMRKKLESTRMFLGKRTVKNEEEESLELDDSDFNYPGAFPSLPYIVCRQFSNKSVLFSNQQIRVENVTSFVKHFTFTEKNN